MSRSTIGLGVDPLAPRGSGTPRPPLTLLNNSLVVGLRVLAELGGTGQVRIQGMATIFCRPAHSDGDGRRRSPRPAARLTSPPAGCRTVRRLLHPTAHCLAPEPGQPRVDTVDRHLDCVATGLSLCSSGPGSRPTRRNPPRGCPSTSFREPVGWLVPMLESNTCSQRNTPTVHVCSLAAGGLCMPKGCANHTIVSSYEPDLCGRWDHGDS
jgi:hypothetical protein